MLPYGRMSPGSINHTTMDAGNSPTLLDNRDEFAHIIETVLKQSKRLGADAAEADIGAGSGLSATVRRGEIDKLEYERDKRLRVTLYIGGQKANVGTSDFSEAALKQTVEAAFAIAGYAGRDEYAGLAAADLMATDIPDLDLYHPWSVAPEVATDIAVTCEQAAFDQDRRIVNSDGATVNTYSGLSLYGNTHGFINGWNWSSHMIDCNVIAKDDSGMQCAGWYSSTRDYKDLQDVADIGRESARRALARIGSRRLSTRRAPVIFEAPIASSLFSAFISAISGSSLYRRASFLLDKKGKQVFADHVAIRERPHIKKALGSAPFDDDGVATGERDIVTDGILRGYVLDAYSARRLGLQTTANAGGVHNLLIEPGRCNLEEMIREVDTGLLVTDMIGFGVNQVTGDYSRGVSGFWFENGEPAYPVEEITVAGNLVEMFRNIKMIGNDIDPRHNILTGSVLIDAMTVAGK